MNNTTPKEYSLLRYRSVIPDILRYQLTTKFILWAVLWLMSLARNGLLLTTTRSAVTSGDLPFLMRSWQGWILLLLGLGVLMLYVIFDINAMILMSSHILHGRKVRVRKILREAFASMQLFRNRAGLAIVLFTAFLLPLSGLGLGISLTENFYIPNFITSVIYSNRLFNAAYTAGLFLILAAAFLYLFTFHQIILGKRDAGRAKYEARRLMQQNMKNFLKRYLLFFIRSVLVGILIIAATIAVSVVIAVIFGTGDRDGAHVLISFLSYGILTIASIYMLLFPPFQMLMLTRIYESYTEEDEGEILYPARRHHPWMWLSGILWLLFLVIASIGTGEIFDEIFPKIGNTAVIAHRAGGTLGNENTVAGLEKAVEAGAEGAEIDIQRTLDGFYVLNHDDTLKRLTGVDAKPSELTLKEIKDLRVPDNYHLDGSEEEFATLEEILDAARGKIHLYIELKGSTADKKMAEDAYQIAASKGMLDEVTFICLSYEEVFYLESQHPDAQTGYLCYASFGEIEKLSVDELILEEETATPALIDRIHAAGKSVSVWTVNDEISMLRFYSRGVDGIITDEVEQGILIRQMLNISDLIDDPDAQEYSDIVDDLERAVLQTIFVLWP